MRISFNEEARAEAEDAVRWYRVNGGAVPAREFSQELRRVVELAAAQPGVGTPGQRGTTRLYFKRFPYTLIFRIQDSSIRVIAIAHQSRRPVYWAGRR
ncbi:MAG: type II toxin-antitoxin system RelE/ParE family toxin [Pseudomonadota bacterium]